MVWKAEDSQGNESGKILWETTPYTRGRGVDLGCGPSKVWPHAIGVDDYTDKYLFGVDMKPEVHANVTKLDIFGSASLDWVFSSHVLEHIKYEDVPSTLKEWWRILKPSGYLILYLPDEDEYPKVGEPGANPDHKWNVDRERVLDPMKTVGGWDLIRCEKRNEANEYSIFFVFKKRSDTKHTYPYTQPKPGKRAAVCRYGAFGDAIQASSILPGLKEQGYHVTFYCTPRTQEVLKHDPNIDEFYIQDTDQVPNHALPQFWAHEAKKYDRFINLSESVEGAWLALPGRTNHTWSIPVRQMYMGKVNYTDFAHALAGVPAGPAGKFYATAEERSWAKKERARIGGDMLIMYSLSGSSVHKVWPHHDSFFARVLIRYPTARIVTVGDQMSQLLEKGWENEPRIVKKSGKYTIRESMSLVEQCDVIVGSETGILNAAALLPMTKICLMSHSSPENLTKHWVNTYSILPKGVDCHPCHAMVYSFDTCRRDDATGTAACQAAITVDQVWEAFEDAQKKAA